MKKRNSCGVSKKRIASFLPSKQTVRLLTVCLYLISVPLFMLLADFSNDILLYPSYALAVYPKMFEYIMLSLALVAGGAFVLEYSLRELKD